MLSSSPSDFPPEEVRAFTDFLVSHLEYRRPQVEQWFDSMPKNHIHDLWVMWRELRRVRVQVRI